MTATATESGTFVRGLQVAARVGVKPDELHRDQILQLDIHVIDDAGALAADTGRLRDTLDYRGIAQVAQQVVERGHFRLVETLAVEICRALLQRTRARAVRVRLDKLNCIPGAAGAGVEVYLDQEAVHREPKPIGFDQIDIPEAVAIVGGGVAGLSAALWCWRLGHPAVLIDPAERLGGQLQHVHFRIPDLPGVDPVSGPALRRRFVQQFIAHRGRWLRAALSGVAVTDGGRVVLQLQETAECGEGRQIAAHTLILAMGVRRRRLDVPGEARLYRRGLLDTASSGVRKLTGKHVLVVGGGDAACENALKLARAGASVSLAFRRPVLSARDRFARRVASQSKISVMPGCEIAEFVGQERLTGVKLKDGRQLTIDAALVRIGFEPNSDGLPPEWLDTRGYVRCDLDLRVEGLSRVFVAGDLRGPMAPSVASSAGDGACAAKAATAFVEMKFPGQVSRREELEDKL